MNTPPLQADPAAATDVDAPARPAVPAAMPEALRISAPLDRLQADPSAFRFFQAVRLMYLDARAARGREWADDPVRFGVPDALGFPPNEIDDLLQPDGKGPPVPRMIVQFLGLTGPSGVLPHAYTRWLIERGRKRDYAPRDFLEIFNHRLVRLFWHAWRKHRPDVSLEFDANRGISRHVFDLVGVGTPALLRQLQDGGKGGDGPRVPAPALAYYAGLISQRPHGLGSISQVVADVAGAPVKAHGCFGNWQTIGRSDRTRLGRQAHAIGDGCVLGSRYWDRQTTIELVVGPLDRSRFDRLLPDGELLSGLVELTRFLTGLALDLRIRLALRADQVPILKLGAQGTQAPRLGWNTWLSGRRSIRPADEARFHFYAMGGESWQ